MAHDFRMTFFNLINTGLFCILLIDTSWLKFNELFCKWIIQEVISFLFAGYRIQRAILANENKTQLDGPI